jgi:hypothetical protein
MLGTRFIATRESIAPQFFTKAFAPPSATQW